MSSHRVLTVGAYERDNFGDLLFLLVTEHYLRGAEVVAAAPFAADMTPLLDRRVHAYGPLLAAERFDAIWTVGGQVGLIDPPRPRRARRGGRCRPRARPPAGGGRARGGPGPPRGREPRRPRVPGALRC